MSSISAILITLNAEKHLKSCLSSLQFVDEIIIVDSGSTDRTKEIALAFTDKFYTTKDWPGFGKQKQRALDKASCNWVLSIDSDEVITPSLKAEILNGITDNSYSAFKVPRLNHFLNAPVRFGGCQKDAPIRLFKRMIGRFSEDLVHERLIIEDGSVGLLKEQILHFTVDSIEDSLKKMDHYSSLSAKQAYQKGKKSSVSSAVIRGTWSFIRHYFLKLGFLDGAAGFAYCRLKSQGCYYKYLKLWAMK